MTVQEQVQAVAAALDQGVRMYRRAAGPMLAAVIIPFVLLLLPSALYLIGVGPSPEHVLAVLLFGVNPAGVPGAYAAFLGALVRDACFADGVLWWTATSGVLAARSGSMTKLGSSPHRAMVWSLVIALLVGLPILFLRALGLGPLADVARLPALFVPLLVFRDGVGLWEAFHVSWRAVQRDWLRCVVVFGCGLALLRGMTAVPLLLSAGAQLWPQAHLAELAYQYRHLSALWAIAVQIFFAPAAIASVHALLPQHSTAISPNVC